MLDDWPNLALEGRALLGIRSDIYIVSSVCIRNTLFRSVKRCGRAGHTLRRQLDFLERRRELSLEGIETYARSCASSAMDHCAILQGPPRPTPDSGPEKIA